MRMIRRLAALLTALTLLCVPAALCEDAEVDEAAILMEEMNETEEIGSEEADLYVAQLELAEMPEAGTYAWYVTPAVPLELHAFVDIYPEESPVYAQEDASSPTGMSWVYAFTLENTTDYDLYASVLTVTYFALDDAGEPILVAREIHDAEELASWWGASTIAAGSAVTYAGGLPLQDVCAVGISIIGNDDKGLEMEFHSLVEFVLKTL